MGSDSKGYQTSQDLISRGIRLRRIGFRGELDNVLRNRILRGLIPVRVRSLSLVAFSEPISIGSCTTQTQSRGASFAAESDSLKGLSHEREQGSNGTSIDRSPFKDVSAG
jgi:hypothetical protein